jgi:hypothetical protein
MAVITICYCVGNSLGWAVFMTSGGFHFPVRASLFGAWSRIVGLNASFGAGSQFDSLSPSKSLRYASTPKYWRGGAVRRDLTDEPDGACIFAAGRSSTKAVAVPKLDCFFEPLVVNWAAINHTIRETRS